MKKTSRKLLSLLLIAVMIASLAVTALAAESFAYSGDDVAFIKEDGSAFGMFAAQDGTTAAIEGDNVVIHFVPKNTTIYNAIHWGAIDDAELTKDLAFNEDGTFDITLPKTECGKAIPVAPIKAKDGATTKDQYYLAIPAADKLGGETEPAERIELAITNNTKMFKFETAWLEGSDLVFTLSGSGYHELVKGTYEDAVAIGEDYDKWIHGSENADGKWQFRISLADGEDYIPVVAVSNSYYTKFLNGEAALARSFFPRQIELDREAKALVTGDYESTAELAVTNNVKMFKVEAASLNTVGGPNSNDYKSTLILTMGSDAFDRAYVGKGSDITESTETIAIGEGRVFEIPVRWITTAGDPDTLVSFIGRPVIMSFHSVNKDSWYDRQFIISEKDGTLVINEAPVITFTDVKDTDYFYDAVGWAVAKKITTGKTETTFDPNGDCTRGQFVTFLWRAAGEPEPTLTANPFADVKENDYFYKAVLWAVEKGITKGKTETAFDPNGTVTRGQAVTFQWRTAGEPASSAQSSFTDIKDGAYYFNAVLWAVEKGITKGKTETAFDPDGNCTRGQVVTFLYRQLG